PSGVSTNAWSGLLLLPGSTATPAAFHFATCSCRLLTLNPTWLITDPTEPPLPGGSSPRLRLTRAPGNQTPTALPRVTGVPPSATKICRLAATSCETRCQWPMVTPASLNGACCASAVPVAAVDASHKPAISVFMEASHV